MNKSPPSKGAINDALLRAAAKNDIPHAIELLQNHNADVNFLDAAPQKNRGRPLHCAITNVNVEMVKLLLSYGANPAEKNREGVDAISFCETLQPERQLSAAKQTLHNRHHAENKVRILALLRGQEIPGPASTRIAATNAESIAEPTMAR